MAQGLKGQLPVWILFGLQVQVRTTAQPTQTRAVV